MEYIVFNKISETCNAVVASFNNPQEAVKAASSNPNYYIRCNNYI